MTKEEYAEKVRDTAMAVLTECSAEEWKQENDSAEFHDFMEHATYDGSYHAVLDATCDLGSWKNAVEILQVTEQNADHVDSGLYEDCDWKKILICIAYECFQWDVNEAAEKIYDSGEFSNEVLAYPDTPHQVGFYPNNMTFKIPDGPWIVNMGDGIKILVSSRYAGLAASDLSVVYEGNVEKRGTNHVRYIVDCRRIYNQTSNSIEEDIKRCEEEFGVREFGG